MDKQPILTVGEYIAKISHAIGCVSKRGQAKFGDRYRYQRWDDVVAELSAACAEFGVAVCPSIESLLWREEITVNGNPWMEVGVQIQIVIRTPAGEIAIRTIGEARDNGDKGVQKAFTLGVKHALLKLFLIPSEIEPDSDGEPPAVADNRKPKKSEPKPEAEPKSATVDDDAVSAWKSYGFNEAQAAYLKEICPDKHFVLALIKEAREIGFGKPEAAKHVALNVSKPFREELFG